LIVTKEHFLSFAHLSNELLCEAETVIEKAKNICSEFYTIPLIFEHGPMNKTNKGGCCVDHAHIHIVAVNTDIQDDFVKYKYEPRRIKCLSNVKIQKKRNMSYFYYRNQKDEQFLVDAPLAESQFMRKLIALKINAKTRYYWTENLKTNWVIDMIQRLKPYFNC